MKITDYLILPKGAKKKKKRCGRGDGSGHGGTSCKGHKGQAARGRTKASKGFEGGQMPLIRRIPKRGFINKFRQEREIINIERLNSFKDETVIKPDSLKQHSLISDASSFIKILGDGKLKKKLEVHAHGFSESAKKAIEQAGGKAILITNEETK
jgi:large subunit ribosomal protein L15